MPPESLRWDRKDFFKERKRERSSESLDSSVSRWRETPHHGYRWGSTDFRRPTGHGKQGGWHTFSEESGHGFAPARPIDKILDGGKYGRNSRENRGSYSRNYWKGHSRETAASPNGSGRPADVNSQRSVDDKLTYNSLPHSETLHTQDQFHFKDQHHENGGAVLGTGERFERENTLGSIDWKPLKWTRSGSLSSRGSGFSHSSSSKSIGVDFDKTKVEAHPRNVTPPVQSPSGDAAAAAACVTSAALTEETSSRKKPRLRWGEGLAKFEKKKVDGPDDAAAKNGMVICGTNTEPPYSHVSNVTNKSPKVAGFSDCASPATPSSVACSSSPGMEDKSFGKSAYVDTGTSNLSSSPCPLSQNNSKDLDFDLENLEFTSVANLSSSLRELLQSDYPSSLDSGFVRSTARNKLLVWKADISKVLEMTESEIDLLENELKSLISDSGSACPCPCPAASSSFCVVCKEKPCDGPCAASNLIPRPTPFQLNSSGDTIMEKTLGALEEENDEVKNEGIDSPGTATSKFVEPLPLGKAVSLPDSVKHGDCSGNIDASRSENLEVKCSVYSVNEEKTGGLSVCGDDIQLITGNSSASLSTEGVHCDRDVMLYDLIITSNKDSANGASEVFSKLLPSNECSIEISRAASGPFWKKDPLIKEKFAKRKRFLRFKERVTTLKYRAFQYLWKEDMRLLSMRRYCAKSHKRLELSSRTVHSGYQKHQPSSRSRFSSPAGNLSLVPTKEMINFTSKLLSDSEVQIYRSMLKMPALVLDNKEKMISRFISSNGLVEDPFAVEKERSMINSWTSEEREIFMDKLATCGKDFRKIASFLDHKTTADCVEFYYKNHKSNCFQKTKKKPDFAKQGKSYSTTTYLVTSGKRWNRETNAASLDMLGAASAVVANVDDVMENQQKCTSRFLRGSSDYKTPRGEDGVLERSGSLDDERETVAADVLAGICGSLSSEAMSSCITSSVDPRAGSSRRQPLTSDFTQNVDDETCSDESYGEMDSSDWTDEEKSIFMQAVSSYGKDFTMISRCITTKSRNQCKVFFSKARKCLGLEMMRHGPSNEGSPTSHDASGGGSDTEDACIVETGSAICSNKSESKIDEEHDTDINKPEENNRAGELDGKDTEPSLEKLVSVDSEVEDKPELDFDGDTNIENNVSSEYPVVQAHENALIHSDTEAGQNEATGHATVEKSVSAGDANNLDLPSISGVEVEKKAVGEVSGEYSRAEMLGHDELLLPESNSLNDKRVENSDVNIPGVSGLNCSIRDSNSAPQSVGNASVFAAESFHMSSKFDFDNISHKQCEKSASIDDYHQHVSGHSLLDHVESSQILRGHPVSVSTKKGMNGDISCTKPALLQSILKLDRNSHSDRYLPQNCCLQKCNSSKHHDSVAELQFLPQEQIRVNPILQQLSSSEEVKPCRNGNVKLFGQILAHPNSSTPENEDKGAQHTKLIPENEDKGSQHSKLSGKSFNLKFTGNHSDGNSAMSKVDRNNYLGLENLPVRSYGFWDGNRIRTGFPSLPDSAILLAKYPAAFGNYPVPSSKIEQRPLHSVVKGNHDNLTGVAVCPAREVNSSNGVANYQVYRNRDGTRVQPFTVNMKQCQEILFSEMQRRSEIESVSTIQHNARGMAGINVVGRGGGILVSDPVAAIKMHYAKTEPYSGQAGQAGRIIGEEESWRGKGEIGR